VFIDQGNASSRVYKTLSILNINNTLHAGKKSFSCVLDTPYLSLGIRGIHINQGTLKGEVSLYD